MAQDVVEKVEPPTDSSPVRRGSPRALTLPQLWAFVAIALPVAAALEATLSSVDLAYGIRLGQIMLHTHSVVRTDTLTFTAAGRPWVDQQWGSQIIFALVYRWGGWAGLAIMRAALVGLIFPFVFLACRAAGASTRRAAGLTLASFAVSVGGLGLRSQLLGMTLFALSVWLVADRHRHPGQLLAMPFIVLLWANLHGTFFLGPLLLVLAWLMDRYGEGPRSNRTLWLAVASAAVATLNPVGLSVWRYAVDIGTNPTITKLIVEWQPPTIRDAVGGVFFISVAAVAVVLARRSRPIPWPVLVWLGVFLLIGLYAVRGVFWWAFVVPPIVAYLLRDVPGRKKLERPPSHVNTAFAAVVVILAISFLPWFRTGNALEHSRSALEQAPPGITAALRTVLRPGDRMFDPQIWGSWFELQLPTHPVFVDARIEVFPASVWKQYLSVSIGQQGWQQILDRWHIDVVVANRGQQAQLIRFIRNDPGWRRVYQDRAGLVFVRS